MVFKAVEYKEEKRCQRIIHMLNPKQKLVDEVVAYLKQQIKEGKPRNFFDHLMVVVPTAESGRALRLALAESFLHETEEGEVGGVLPPMVVQPMHLIQPAINEADANAFHAATDVELQAAFLTFIEDPQQNVEQWDMLFQRGCLERKEPHAFLGFLDQLNEIWYALSSNGLLMQDVLEHPQARMVLERAEGVDFQRWEQLASFEQAFFSFLEAHNLWHHARYIQMAINNPAPLPEVIDAILLPALVDPVRVLYPILERCGKPIHILIHADEVDRDKFDEWGRPKPEDWTGEHAPTLSLQDEDIVRTATNTALGMTVAEAFSVQSRPSSFPALGLVDSGVYSDVQASFLSAGVEVYNPEKHTLRVSSLGVLLDLLVQIWEKRAGNVDWKVISALLKIHDVIVLFEGDRTAILKSLDHYANTRFPRVEPSGVALEALKVECDRRGKLPFNEMASALEWLRTEVLNPALSTGASLVAFLHECLVRIYPKVDAPNKEFLAAIQAVNDLFETFSSERLSTLPTLSETSWCEIVRRAIASATYQLDAPKDAIKTLGWLELAWSPVEQIALAGFHEGCVPDALIGHAFLPESLRFALGLTSNLQRLARDTYLLKSLLDARQPHDVRVFISLTNANGDIQRPSRLLFLCADDALPKRAQTLFGDLPSIENGGSRDLPETMRYQWPSEVPLPSASASSRGHLSPSAIDTYIQCPFTYFLTYGLGMSTFAPKEELGADDFGNLTHTILERYAREQINRTQQGLPQSMEASEIRASLVVLFDTYVRECYGTHRSVGLQLQLDALKARLLSFASLQAQWAHEGWEIAYTEYWINGVECEGVPLHGAVDRIDRKRCADGSFSYRVIDYKTWDQSVGAKKKLFGSSAQELAFAETHAFPTMPPPKSGNHRRFLTIQLPLYGWAIQQKVPAIFKDRVVSMGYLVLGKSQAQVAFVEEDLMAHQDTALTTVRIAIDQIKNNIFWPPGPSGKWQWSFGSFFLFDPEKDAPTAWATEQNNRLSRWHQAKEREETHAN